MSEEQSDREFHDPDYPEVVPVSKISVKISGEERAEKIRQIVKREFDAEITRRENDLDILDERLVMAKKTLSSLRYAIIKHHYTNEKLYPTDDEVQAEISSQSDPTARLKVQSMLKNQQKQIHPAIKKILGNSNEIDFDEILKVRVPRKRVKLESTINQEPIAGPSQSTDSQSSTSVIEEGSDDKSVKIPRYIEPKGLHRKVLEINPNIRNKQKTKFRIIIGNTSKYTAPQSKADRSTHKWLLYIRGPRESPDVSHFISSVSVQLHDSYAPHNIFHLRSPPYHISRRGWGEFPVKLRIHFKNEKLNKPVNIEHLLKLDRNYSGLQELGGETVVDVWLYADDTMLENKIKKPPEKNVSKITSNTVHQSLKEGHTLLNTDFFPLCSPLVKTNLISGDKCEEVVKEHTISHQTPLLSNTEIKPENMNNDIMEMNETRVEGDAAFREVLNNIKKEKEEFVQDNCHSDSNGFINKIKDQPIDDPNVMEAFYNHESSVGIIGDNFNNIEDNFGSTSNIQVLPIQNNLFNPKRESLANNVENNMSKVIIKQPVSLLKRNNSRSLLNPAVIKNLSPAKKIKLTSSRSILKCNNNIIEEKKPPNSLFLLNSMLNDHCYVNEKYLIHNMADIHQKNVNENVSVKVENPSQSSLYNSKHDQVKSFNLMCTNKGILFDGATLLNNFPKTNSKIILGKNNDSKYRIELSKTDCIARQKVIDTVSFFRDNLDRCSDTRSAVSLLLKKMPMIDESANSGEFLKIFPYSVQNTDVYFSLDRTKRRNLEWTRAKIIQNYMKMLCSVKSQMEIWTTKQIILFSHYHGYYPVKSTFTDNENANFDNSDNFYIYGYNGEKTFQEKIDLKEQFASASHINTKTKIDVFTSSEINIEKPSVINIKKEFPSMTDNDSNTDPNVGNNVKNIFFIKNESNSEITNSNHNRSVIFELDDSSDDEIDICDVSDDKSQEGHSRNLPNQQVSRKMAACEVLPFESDNEKLQCIFIERKCAEIGIELKNEHVGNGFSDSLVHKTILASLKCLVEDIARRSLAVKMAAMDSKMDVTIDNIGQTSKRSPKLWDKTESGSVHTVSLRHVYEGILGRKELDLLTNRGLGSDIVEYHGNL